MAGWLHGVFVGEWLFVFPLCGFSLSLFCNYRLNAQVAQVSHYIITATTRQVMRNATPT